MGQSLRECKTGCTILFQLLGALKQVFRFIFFKGVKMSIAIATKVAKVLPSDMSIGYICFIFHVIIRSFLGFFIHWLSFVPSMPF